MTLYGVIGIFSGPEETVDAAKVIRGQGYTEVEAFSPFEIHGLDQYLKPPFNPVAGFCLVGGIVGGLAGFFMQYYAYVVDFPLNVGGRPYNSWPAFIPVTFELTILSAVFFAVISMLLLNGLPKPHHPIFNSEKFNLASGDRFCLCVKSKDPQFDAEKIIKIFKQCDALATEEIKL